MRKWYFISILVLSGAVHAADESLDSVGTMDPYKMRVGVHAGFDFASARIDPSSNSSNRFVGMLGAYIDSPVLPGFLHIQPELNIVQKGAKNAFFGGDATSALTYLEFPILAKIRFLIPHTRPFVVAGPAIGYLLSGNVEGPGIALDRSQFSGLEISMMLGAGVGFQLSDALDATEFTVSARYSVGLNDIASNAGSWKSNVFQIAFGVML